MYRKADVFLDYIKMIDDQTGPGDEEFHISGFVQEQSVQTQSSGTLVRIPHKRITLDPDDRSKHPLGYAASFHLNDPDTKDWPRLYSVVVSVLEEDDGDVLATWLPELWQIAQKYIVPLVRDAVEEFVEQLARELIEGIMSHAAEVARIATMLVQDIACSICSTILSIAVAIISTAIVESMEDDYYGTKAFMLMLPTDITDYIWSLPGTPRGDGGYALQPQAQRFRGEASFPVAAGWDGVVEIGVRWEFWQKEALA